MKRLKILLYLVITLCFCVNNSISKPTKADADKVRAGLAGAQYDDEEFTEVDEDANILYGLNQHWAASRGNDWRAAWFGFIEGPYTGDVMISAEFEDGLELEIDGKVIVDGIKRKGRNKMSGMVKMTKGKKVPISVKLITYNSKAFLRVSWQWGNSEMTLVPDEVLSYKLSELPLDLRFEFEYTGLKNAQNWAIYAPAKRKVPASQIDVSDAKIMVLQDVTILNKAADMVHDEILKRSRTDMPVVEKIDGGKVCDYFVIGTRVDMAKNGISFPAGLTIPEKADGYAIWVDKHGKSATVYVIGYDKRGALFGAGRLLRLLDMGRDWAYLDKDVRIATAPVTKLRGHQIGYRPKTNSYDGWTIEMWEQYYRDMIVFGTNAVELLPPRTDDALDSPHFPEPPLQMMVKMSQLAKDYGLDVWIWFPSMEDGYDDQNVLQVVLDEWDVVYKALPKIDVVFVPGGDPGNTHPSELLAFMEKQKKNMVKYHPNGQIWMSPQGFDWRDERKGWLRDFYDILNNEKPEYLGGVVFGPQIPTSLANLRKAVPAQYPIRRYPDITHSGGGQYEVDNWDDAYDDTLGREPINPRPYFYAKIYRKLEKYAVGFITYSEGCNDDLNKIVWSCLGWNPEMKVEDILAEYSKYFISYEFKDKFAKGLAGLEKNWEGKLRKNEQVYQTLELFQEMEKQARPADLLNWRFQQGLYRAYYDAYVKARLPWSKVIEKQTEEVLEKAESIGSLVAIEKAEEIIDRQFDDPVALLWQLRIHELAEALFQSARMQMSVPKYKAIRQGRGATLDTLDAPLFDVKDMKRDFMYVRMMDSEAERLRAIKKIID